MFAARKGARLQTFVDLARTLFLPAGKVSRGKFIALAVAVRVDRRFAFGLQRLRSVDKPIWLVAFFFAPVAKWIFFALKP